MGGAMDLAENSKNVLVLMEHVAKDGSHKILNKCSHPLTAQQVVNKLITDLGVFEFKDRNLYLTEIAEGIELEEIRSKTGCDFSVADDLKTF